MKGSIMSLGDHNKVLAALHLFFGGLNALALVSSFGFFFESSAVGVLRSVKPAAALWPGSGGDPIFLLILLLLFSVPSLIAGWGMLGQKSWAQGAGVIASIAVSLSPPLGTALCVYSLWFLFGEGRHFYANRAEEVRHGAATGAVASRGGAKKANGDAETEYEQPVEPPNWRD